MYIKDFIEYFTLWIVFPAIVCSGTYLTLKLRFIQIFQLKKSFLCIAKKNTDQEGNISHFGAISSVLAGNFGTGNISGMAVAIATGGPGALVWMWVMAFFGAAIQYVSCVLSISFRQRTAKNEYVGGPMYYLRDGLGYKILAILFAVFTLFGSITVGNFAQINSVVLPLEKMGFNPLYCSVILAIVVGIVILGGIQRIANFASYIVPFKALIYLGTAFVIIVLQYDKVLPSFRLMFQHAFGFSSFIGGALGIGVFRAMTTGFDRGLFATDAGTGIVPILQASAHTKNPIINGITTLITPLIVMIVCTTTGLVLIITGAWQIPDLYSTNMVTYAFSQGLHSAIGEYIVIIALVLFAYTTILAWSYCGEKALGFLIGNEKAYYFRFFYVLLIPIGSVMKVDLIWSLADIAISLMLVTNLIGVMKLSKRVILSSYQFKLSN
ncbi:MAG: amino acid carrier protein [Chlamydiales bacterium]|jgi:AGCS family alanine or glycine:cation symporter|nr:amino acid carrier protein [Chlamydiales bacterium]